MDRDRANHLIRAEPLDDHQPLTDALMKRLEIEARLSLAQPSSEAAAPYLRESLRTALIPQIETTKAVGIVFLPGAMVGLSNMCSMIARVRLGPRDLLTNAYRTRTVRMEATR